MFSGLPVGTEFTATYAGMVCLMEAGPYAEIILGDFQWYTYKLSTASPPNAVEFIHSQTAFVAIFFVFCNTIYLTATTGYLRWK